MKAQTNKAHVVRSGAKDLLLSSSITSACRVPQVSLLRPGKAMNLRLLRGYGLISNAVSS
jgi:hypothetical protein